jgi:NADH-quinone oxidoreductase subunit L
MDDVTYPIVLIILLPLFGAVVNLLIGRKMSRRFVHTVGVGVVAAALGVAVWLVAGPLWAQFAAHQSGALTAAPALEQTLYTWIEVGRLQIDLAFRLDTLSALMVLIVTFVGLLIHIYSTGYMNTEPRYAAYFGYLNLFTASMLILVLADNLPVMFIGWEAVGLCSYLLIGFWFEKEQNSNAGRKAFVVNRIGDFAFILGMSLLFWATGTLSFTEFQTPEAQSAFAETFLAGERVAMWAGLLLFIGACGKTAQIPLYVWLPDAMAGPTPVSAIIHGATMVTAGVYMVARMSWMYASSTTTMAIVAGIGAATALLSAIIATSQRDLKKVLAYSTVSQLGFMVTAVGVGAYVAGIFHLLTHAFFKAGLFLSAGAIIHAMSGSGDIMKMGGLRKAMPRTHISYLVFCLAIAGIVPFSGFFSKDEILVGALTSGGEGWWPFYGHLLWLMLTAAAACTAFYMFRTYFLIFSGESRADAETKAHIHESPSRITSPLLVLAAFTTVLGFVGLPHLSFLDELGVAGVIGTWLDPSVKSGVVPGKLTDAGKLQVAGLVLVLAIGAILTARALYARGVSPWLAGKTSSRGFGRLHKVVADKFYVDEFYELVVLRPFRWATKALFHFVDRFVIDTVFVNGPAKVVGLIGAGVRKVQNGQVQRYLAALIVGGALLFFFASRPSLELTYEQLDGRAVSFEAVVDAGPASVGAEIEWDFDGDGHADATGPQAIWTFSQPGRHEVTVRLRDGVFGRWTRVTRVVVVEDAEASRADERGRSR